MLQTIKMLVVIVEKRCAVLDRLLHIMLVKVMYCFSFFLRLSKVVTFYFKKISIRVSIKT